VVLQLKVSHVTEITEKEIQEPIAEKVKTMELELRLGDFGGLGVSALASGTQVRRFKPGRSRRIFQGEKMLSMPSFGREVKLWVPCH
jgi:hypothetical protein